MIASEQIDARIARRVTDAPDSLALVAAGETLTYRQLWEYSERAARSLAGTERVAVLPVSDTGSMIMVVAAIRAGCSLVLLHRHVLADHLRRVLEIAGTDRIVASAGVHARLRRLGTTGPIVTPDEVIGASGRRLRAVDEHAELLVGLTSGTSGRPKLFVRGRYSWARTLDRSDEEFTVDAGSWVAAPGVLDHTHFLYGALHALTRGAVVDVRPLHAWPTAGYSPTHVYTVPTIAHDLVHGPRPVPRSIREVLSSGAFWSPPGRTAVHRALPGATTVHYYGASELSLVALNRWTTGNPSENPPPESAGRLVSGVEVDIRDGITHVRSDMLFDGYLDDGPVRGGPVDGWMSVGDRGEMRSGELYLSGRSTDTIIRGGLNVEPTDIERALLEFTGIVDAACVGVPDERMGHVPVAAVVASGGVDHAALRRHLLARLEPAAMPTRVVVMDGLPRTPRGKLDRPAVLKTVGPVEPV